MKNSIAERITDFLKEYPPFNYLPYPDLYALATETKIIYLEKDETLFSQGKKHQDFFYIVNQGAIRLYHKETDRDIEIEINDEGDVFGLRPLIVDQNYTITAKAYEESIVYGLPIEIFKEQFENNKDISKYLITRFASNSTNKFSSEDNNKIFADYKRTTTTDYFSTQASSILSKAITCSQHSTIQFAANVMVENKISRLIISDENDTPVGIVTNKDMLRMVATGKVLVMDRVSKIMSSPIITAEPNTSVAEAQLIMLKNKMGNICITENGNSNSKTIGMLTQQDIMATVSNNPAILMKQVMRTDSIQDLRSLRQRLSELLDRYIKQKISFTHTLSIVAELNETINYRIVELSIEEYDKTLPVKFTVFSMGSQARKEQLIPTDQDNGLIFEEVPDDILEETRAQFIELANVINKNMYAVGYDYCNAEMMASNPKWCLSSKEWKEQFKKWIYNPTEKSILLSSIFFDFSLLYGNKELLSELYSTIYEHISNNQRFFMFMAKDALKIESPLGFFRHFVVEQDGEHKDQFNIKAKAIMPLVDAARLLTLNHHIKGLNNTAERYYKLRELEPQNAEVYEACAYAFKALLKIKTKNSLDFLGEDDGKFIDIENLTKEEKEKLKRCFKPIKSVQEILKVRFNALL